MEEKLKIDLYEKLDNEYHSFVDSLRNKTPDEIIECSYEKIMKEELKEMFYPGNNYEISELKALYKSKNPLEELYQGWMKFDGGIQEELRYSVEDTLKLLNKNGKNRDLER